MRRTLAKGLVLVIEAGIDLLAERLRKRSVSNGHNRPRRTRRGGRRRSISKK